MNAEYSHPHNGAGSAVGAQQDRDGNWTVTLRYLDAERDIVDLTVPHADEAAARDSARSLAGMIGKALGGKGLPTLRMNAQDEARRAAVQAAVEGWAADRPRRIFRDGETTVIGNAR